MAADQITQAEPPAGFTTEYVSPAAMQSEPPAGFTASPEPLGQPQKYDLPAPVASQSITGRLLDATMGPDTAAANVQPGISPWEAIVPGSSVLLGPAGDKPTVNLGALHAEDLVPGQGTPSKVSRGVVKGGADFLSGLTSPQQVALMSAIPGVGKIPVVGKTLSRFVSAGFSLDMIVGAVSKSPQLVDQIQHGDVEGGTQTLTSMALEAGMAYLSGKHAIRPGEVAPGAPPPDQPIPDQAQAAPPPGFQPESPAAPEMPIPGPTVETPAAAALPDRYQEARAIVQETGKKSTTMLQRRMRIGYGQASRYLAQMQEEERPKLPSELLATPEEVDQETTVAAQQFVEAATRPQPENVLQTAVQTPAPPQETPPNEPVQQSEQIAQEVSQQETPGAPGPAIERPAGEPQQSEQPATDAAASPADAQGPVLAEVKANAEASPTTVGPELQKLREDLALSPDLMGKGKLVAYAKLPPDVQARVDRLADGILKPKPAPAVTAKDRGKQELARRRELYTPGNVVKTNDGGSDKVLEYNEKPDGTFSVKVQAVLPDGSNDPDYPRPRTHSTPPGKDARVIPPAAEAKQDTGPAYGKPVNVAVPGEETNYPARYAIRELSDVQPSHHGMTFEANPTYQYQNDRDYKNNPEISALVADRSGPKFDPNYVASESPTAEHGGPVIDPRGNVLGGNSRSMTLGRVYESNPEGVEKYKTALRDRAASYGLKPENLERFKQPVMVRELNDQPDEAGAQRAITDFNKKGAASLTPGERAVADGRLMSRNTIAMISAKLENVGEDSMLAQAVQGDNGAQIIDALIKDGVVSQQERGALVDDRDLLTGEAKDRIAKMLVGRMFESPAQFQATPPELRNKLERVAPQVLRLEGRHGWSITPAVQEALGLLADVRSHGGKSLKDFLEQPDLQGEKQEYSPEAVGLAKTLSGGPLKAASAFRQFANDEALSREGAPSTFFEPPTREEAFNAAFNGKPFISAMRVPRLSGEAADTFVTGAPNSFHARLMRFEEYPLEPGDAQHAVAYVTNPSGIEYLHRMTGAPHDSGGPHIGAIHLTPENALRVAGRARHMSMYGPTSIYGDRPAPPAGVVHLAELAKQAGVTGKSLIVLSDHAGFTDEQKLIGVREELDHVLQSQLTGDPRTHLGNRAELLADQNELGRRAVRALSAKGYTFRSFGEAAMEIGVRLMSPNRHGELGLSRAEARPLGAQYVRSLRKEHGSVRPREIAKRVFNALRRTDPRGGRQPDAGTRSLRQERGNGSPGGDEPDSSAYRPGANSDQRRGLRGAVPSGRETEDSQSDLFGSQENEQSKVDAQRGEYKLLGDQLTAQIRSGLAARPTKLKPAENRGLFDEETPETGNLFDTYRPKTPEDDKKAESAWRQFMGDQTGTSKVGATFKADLKDMRALMAKREAAAEALKKAKADPVGEKAGNELAEYYMAERDLWSTRVNQVIGRLRKSVPDTVDQEALSILRDFTHRASFELPAWLNGTHPVLKDLDQPSREAVMKNIERLRPAIERAMNPTPLMKKANDVLTQIAEASGKEAEHRGMIPKGLDPQRYFSHLLNPKGEGDVARSLGEHIGSVIGGKLGKSYAFAARRSYPTVLDAIADKVVPKTLNVFDAFTIHGDKFATSRATHLLLDRLHDTGMGIWDSMKGGDKLPEGWVKLAPHSTEFHNEIPIVDSEGEPQVVNQALWVHPAVSKAMRPITDPDYMHVVKGFVGLRGWQALMKQAQLSLSMFHARALNIMALGNMGPTGWVKGLRADRFSPEFERGERDLVIHGGTSPIQGKSVEAYQSLQPGSIPSWTDIWRRGPGLHQMDQAAKAISEFTFNNLQRRFKVTDYMIHSSEWLADHPNASTEEVDAAKRSIAKEVNAVYGGLNWERLGINHATLEVARAIMLAPDWTFSNIFNVKYSMEKGTPAGKLARAFWLRTIVGGLIATQLMSYLLSRKPSKQLTTVYAGKDKKGQDVYQNMFFAGAPQDASSMIGNIADYGAVEGLVRTMANKTAPGLHVAMDLAKNEDFLGRPIVQKGMHPLASTVRGAMYAAKGVLPIPYSAQNMKDMLVGPEAKKYAAWEIPATLISGNPPRHVAPSGRRMTKHGLVTTHPKPLRSTWQEIMTGKR